MAPTQILSHLTKHFDEEELKTLCFGLDIHYDDLRGEGRKAKARELVAYAERHGRLPDLIAAIKRERPNIANVENHLDQRENDSYSLWFYILFTVILLSFLTNLFWLFRQLEPSIQNQQVTQMETIIGIASFLVGVVLGVPLIAVGSGLWHFAPRMRFKPNRSSGTPNSIEIILGLLLIAVGFAIVLNWQPWGIEQRILLLIQLALLSLVLMIGYIKLGSFTILRNISNAEASSRILGVILAIATGISWLFNVGQGLLEPASETVISATPAINSIEAEPTPTEAAEILPVARPIARFQNVQDGAQVGITIPAVNGTYRHIPPTDQLWIVARSSSTCYPMDGAVIRDATEVWRHTEIRFPQLGETYLLLLVSANPELANILEQAVGKQTGFPCHSIEESTLDTITVTVLEE